MPTPPEDKYSSFGRPPKKRPAGTNPGEDTEQTLPIWITAGPGGGQAFIVGFSFPDVESTRFARIALEKGFATRDDVKACFDRVIAMREQGAAKSLAEIMQEEGLITARQAELIASESPSKLDDDDDAD